MTVNGAFRPPQSAQALDVVIEHGSFNRRGLMPRGNKDVDEAEINLCLSYNLRPLYGGRCGQLF